MTYLVNQECHAGSDDLRCRSDEGHPLGSDRTRFFSSSGTFCGCGGSLQRMRKGTNYCSRIRRFSPDIERSQPPRVKFVTVGEPSGPCYSAWCKDHPQKRLEPARSNEYRNRSFPAPLTPQSWLSFTHIFSGWAARCARCVRYADRPGINAVG